MDTLENAIVAHLAAQRPNAGLTLGELARAVDAEPDATEQAVLRLDGAGLVRYAATQPKDSGFAVHKTRVVCLTPGGWREVLGLQADRGGAERGKPASKRHKAKSPSLDPAVLEAVRRILSMSPNAKSTKPDEVIKAAGVSQQAGRRALRKLERLGEYFGFTRACPKRYSR